MINEIANVMGGFRDDVECFSLNTSTLWIIHCRNHARSFHNDNNCGGGHILYWHAGDEVGMTAKLFESALGIEEPWYVRDISFDVDAHKVTIFVGFTFGSLFQHPDVEGVYPVYDSSIQRYRHLDFFGHKCILEVQVPRVELPDGSVRMVEPAWPASRCGSKLGCEALSRDNISSLRQPGQRKAA